MLRIMDRKLELVRSLALLTSQHFANRSDAQIPLVYSAGDYLSSTPFPVTLEEAQRRCV